MLPVRLALVAILSLASLGMSWGAQAFAQFGEPKYGPDFTHFAYVNPQAPKGGRISLSIVTQTSSFDKLNPFTLKGRPAPGLQELVFETLAFYGLDEPNTIYGLLADDIDVAKDFSAVTFRINPAARFSNGDPLTVEDVRASFATLTGKDASPRFRSYFAEIAKVAVIDDRRITFTFKRRSRDLVFVAGSLPVFSAKWGARADGSVPAFDALLLEPPLASGPYVVDHATGGLNIVFRRNPHYWAADLPIRRGQYNFDQVTFQLYKDADTQVAALRGGEFDFFSETRMRYWVAQYIGPRFDSGELVKLVVPHQNPPALNGWVYNQRRARFQDPRVRAALNYAYDWEWINDKILDSEFKRITSVFAGTELAATGVPGPAELKILEPYRSQLDPAVFGPMFVQPATTGQGGLGFRANLATALDLFAQAGWTLRDGALRNAAGERFIVEVPGSKAQSPLNDPYEQALRRLGIDVRKAIVDAAVTRARLNDFDFDFTAIALRDGRNPANELWRTFNFKAADTKGSENLAGVKSPVIDALLLRLRDAATKEEQIAVGRALDRVIMHGQHVLPWRYLVKHYLMFNRRLARPETLPTHYGANEWALATWWDTTAVPGPLSAR